MKIPQRTSIISGLFVFVWVGLSAVNIQEGGHFTNLKVLPKNMTEEEMDFVMTAIKKQLGVNCYYCHKTEGTGSSERFDFASDEKPEKKIARQMLKMTIKLNKKYFGIKSTIAALYKPMVSCKTCHFGQPVPSLIK